MSHRPSLFKYHKFLIKFDGEGGWAFSQLDSDKEVIFVLCLSDVGFLISTDFVRQLLSIQEEIKSIKAQLDDIPRVEERLEEIRKELRI